MPETIGVLTSNTGAVIRDIINVSTRRNPNVHIRLLPVPVQGAGAAEKIVDAIKIMNEKKLADVIILARGGGSLEDLWPFNEEILARAIYDSELPIISAVGQLAVADIDDLKYTLNLYNRRLKMSLQRKLQVMKLRYEKCMSSRVYKEPLQKINEKYLLIDKFVKSIENSAIKKLKDCKLIMTQNVTKLDTLSPLKTISRGYSITIFKQTNKIINNIEDVKSGDQIEIKVNNGSFDATVN